MKIQIRALCLIALAAGMWAQSPTSPLDSVPLKNWAAPLHWLPPSAQEAQRQKAAGASALDAAGATQPLQLVAITPCRVVDTRAGSGFPGAFGPPSLQGSSVAEWVMAMGGRAGRGGQGQPGAQAQRGGSLKVTTTNLRPGYLRKNGAPYSAGAVVTEFYDLTHELNGSTWMVVKTIVTDPAYLYRPFVTSTNLRKQPDAAGWSPSACEAK